MAVLGGSNNNNLIVLVTAYTYYIMKIAKCTCTCLHHLLKLLTSALFCCVPIKVSHDGFMLRLICVSLACDLPKHLLLKSLSSAYDDRLVDLFHHVQIHITKH